MKANKYSRERAFAASTLKQTTFNTTNRLRLCTVIIIRAIPQCQRNWLTKDSHRARVPVYSRGIPLRVPWPKRQFVNEYLPSMKHYATLAQTTREMRQC